MRLPSSLIFGVQVLRGSSWFTTARPLWPWPVRENKRWKMPLPENSKHIILKTQTKPQQQQRCETNKTSAEAARGSASHVVKTAETAAPWSFSWWLTVYSRQRAPGGISPRSHKASQMSCVSSECCRWHKMSWHPDAHRESRGAFTSSSASVFHLWHLWNSEGGVYGGRRNLYPAVTSTARRKQNCLGVSVPFYATFLGTRRLLFSVQMGCLLSGCVVEEETPRRLVHLLLMHAAR